MPESGNRYSGVCLSNLSVWGIGDVLPSLAGDIREAPVLAKSRFTFLTIRSLHVASVVV